jgi:hypothetical protein
MIRHVRKISESERRKWRHKPKSTPPAPVEAAVQLSPYDQARIDKWIRDRVLVDWRDSCWRCRKPIISGQLWTTVAGDIARARFHQDCHTGWRIEQETLARRALGLPDIKQSTTKETTTP